MSADTDCTSSSSDASLFASNERALSALSAESEPSLDPSRVSSRAFLAEPALPVPACARIDIPVLPWVEPRFLDSVRAGMLLKESSTLACDGLWLRLVTVTFKCHSSD